MEKLIIDRFQVQVSKLKDWSIVAYLIIDVIRRHAAIEKGLIKVVNGQDRVFTKLIQTHVAAYLEKGTMPPAEIAGPILNIAEDVMAGRPVVLKAGDYIALQNFRRA
jgi:hypothetical protein